MGEVKFEFFFFGVARAVVTDNGVERSVDEACPKRVLICCGSEDWQNFETGIEVQHFFFGETKIHEMYVGSEVKAFFFSSSDEFNAFRCADTRKVHFATCVSE